MLGGDFQEGFIYSLSDVEGELVVNCTGLGSESFVMIRKLSRSGGR